MMGFFCFFMKVNPRKNNVYHYCEPSMAIKAFRVFRVRF